MVNLLRISGYIIPPKTSFGGLNEATFFPFLVKTLEIRVAGVSKSGFVLFTLSKSLMMM